MPYQSPISPGRSWYEDTVGERPSYPPLRGSVASDVAIIGGGYAGLSAAAYLARAGIHVVLIEAHRFGDGASGRNGGQLGTGQRVDVDEMERVLGFPRAKALFDLAEDAKKHVLGFAAANDIDIDFQPGHLHVTHKPRELPGLQRHVETMSVRYGYRGTAFMDAAETADRTGSTHYCGGVLDTGTGHIHPLKLLAGTARVAAQAGARLYENTRATAISRSAGKIVISAGRASVTADKCFVAVNAHGGRLEPGTAAHVMPIGSFIAATAPLPANSPVLPGGESVADTRFVVRYFRRVQSGELLFGGREIYSAKDPKDIRLQLRRQIAETWPALKDIEITHGWGGYVGITLPRMPFAREVMPGVISAGGWSGHGVMLSHFTGRLYAETIAGNRERLRLFEDLNVPAFPGGRLLRRPLLFLALNWYALRDRI